MKRAWALLATALLATALLTGCLEVEQHPRWANGLYDGKPDQRVHAAQFHGDRLAWNAATTDRTLQQDEFRRAKP